MPTTLPRLYHAPSSYYSMIARLALAERGIAYEPVILDIHRRTSQHDPAYVRLNPHMTVPTLVLPGRVLDDSRLIAEFAFGVAEAGPDEGTKDWLDRHYAFPIEDLTIGGLLARHSVPRRLIPRKLAATQRHLLALAAQNPDLAEIYRARADVFAARLRQFDPVTVAAMAAQRQAEAIALLERLEAPLAAGHDVLVPPAHGLADVVWTVFLARMEFAGLGGEIVKRPALAAYWRAMQARPSFAVADIWTRLHIFRLLAGMFVPRGGVPAG